MTFSGCDGRPKKNARHAIRYRHQRVRRHETLHHHRLLWVTVRCNAASRVHYSAERTVRCNAASRVHYTAEQTVRCSAALTVHYTSAQTVHCSAASWARCERNPCRQNLEPHSLGEDHSWNHPGTQRNPEAAGPQAGSHLAGEIDNCPRGCAPCRAHCSARHGAC
jgi:hypothetical protein